MVNHHPNNIDVVILCGGPGKRLRSAVSKKPKSMAEICGRPFLDILIDYVASFGFVRFILCIGYGGDYIRQYYQKQRRALEIIFSEEKEFLGTAGAIKNAETFIRSSPFLVMNGDTFCQVDLKDFLISHLNRNALLSMVVTNAKRDNGYGIVIMGDSQRITEFNKKIKSNKSRIINTGIYLFQQKVLSLIPNQQKFSLEEQLFPKVIKNENIFGYSTQGLFIDIGTPARYKLARQIFSIYS